MQILAGFQVTFSHFIADISHGGSWQILLSGWKDVISIYRARTLAIVRVFFTFEGVGGCLSKLPLKYPFWFLKETSFFLNVIHVLNLLHGKISSIPINY